TATDAAGNTTKITDSIQIDQTSPVVTLDPLVTKDATPALSGTIDDPTAEVVVTVGGVDYPATNNGDGTWTLADDVVAALSEGSTVVTVTATDKAGNLPTTITGTVEVDTTRPTVTIEAADALLTAGEST